MGYPKNVAKSMRRTFSNSSFFIGAGASVITLLALLQISCLQFFDKISLYRRFLLYHKDLTGLNQDTINSLLITESKIGLRFQIRK